MADSVDDERQQLLERARLIQQAREIQMRSMDPPGENHGPLDTVGETALRVLDYVPGYMRTGVATAQGHGKAALTGDTSGIPTSQDWSDTVHGRAPLMNYYNTKLGIPKGGSLSDKYPDAYAKPGDESAPWYQPEKGGIFDPTARGGASTVEDMLLSPATVIGAAKGLWNLAAPAKTAAQLREAATAARAAQAAKAAQTPIQAIPGAIASVAASTAKGSLLNDAAESAGAFMHRQPFDRADVAAMDAGKGPRAVSKIALDNGVWGASQQGLEAQLKSLAQKAAARAEAIEEKFKGSTPKLSSFQGFDGVHQAADPFDRSALRSLSDVYSQSHPAVVDRLNSIYNRGVPVTVGEALTMAGAPEALGGGIPTRPILQPTIDKAFQDTLSDTPQRVNAGQKVQSELGRVAERNPEMDIDRLIQYKRDQQNIASSMSQYDNPMVSPDPTGNSKFEGPLRQDVANNATRTIENVMDANKPGLGGKYHKENATYGTIRSGLPGSNQLSKSEIIQELIPNPADAPFILGGGMMGGAMHHTPEGLAMGYLAAKAVNSPIGQTGVGLTMNRAGRYGLIDPAVRETLGQRYRKGGTSPWSLMKQQ